MASIEADLEERSTFFVKGKTYLAKPTMDEFLREAEVTPASRGKVKGSLKKLRIEKVELLFSKSLKELGSISQISETIAMQIFDHAIRIKRQGDIINPLEEVKKNEGGYQYLPTGSSSLDEMLNYTNGKVGWRSRTMTELYGPPSSGKTQICLTAAAICLRPVDKGGWGRGVVYIDSEGAFEGTRFEYLAKYWGCDDEHVDKNFHYGRADSFDEVEAAIDEAYNRADEINLGMIIVDSIMDPLKSQYIIGGSDLKNLQPRQQHLKRVLDKMKNLATLKNAICFYTNHVRAEIGGYGPSEGPQGGAVMGHASDIRIKLKAGNKADYESVMKKTSLEKVGMKIGGAKIVDCGFLAEKSGIFLCFRNYDFYNYIFLFS